MAHDRADSVCGKVARFGAGSPSPPVVGQAVRAPKRNKRERIFRQVFWYVVERRQQKVGPTFPSGGSPMLFRDPVGSTG